jgi:NAD(P)-dependent dehydrogenase (short-subunit alcohol dehydrogenase family)
MSSNILKDLRLVVTGAGTGLGAAYAEAAAAAGASVIINDLAPDAADRTAERIAAANGTSAAIAGDVSDSENARTIVEFCVERFGGIDGLVNNAGIVGRVQPMLENSEDLIRKVVEVNVLGTAFVGVHAARAMVAQGTGGVIVNVSSGDQCGVPGFSIYGASKAAVSSLTFGWARDLAEYGIRVNAISPHAHTALTDGMIAALGYNPDDRGLPDPTVEDNAAVVTFLLSEAARELNGQILRLEPGGFLSLFGHPVVIDPRVHIKDISHKTVASAFTEHLANAVQPLGVSLASVTHLPR